MIPAEYLDLSLKAVLALHDPRRALGPASADDITAAVGALEAKVAAEDAARAAEQREWLASRIDGLLG